MAGAPALGAPLPGAGDTAAQTAAVEGSSAAFVVETLRKRPDFLLAAKARRKAGPAFLLQARDRRDDSATVRVGFTCSKKVGNAVIRNRAKRRLRALAQETLPALAKPGWDYVLVGFRDKTIARPYAALQADLHAAMSAVHAPKSRS